ncbi:hypothetical protein L9F63_009764 [Diploptera punctata]|uniref:Phosphatidylinositol-specific phospholipase C X domain-containing protein n=1 Tax=Diploptera punctata TaxID=6984 RepID=A0AAD8ERP8_DIPPU|nr:hypothetical protein L9F63_009764 [Diploptera punctata]
MWFVFLLFLSYTHFSAARVISTNECQQLRVSVLVSSRNTNQQSRQLILSWENASPATGDWVGLFDSETMNSPLQMVSSQSTNGWVYTDIHETPTSSGDLGYVSRCLGYWAGYFTAQNETLATGCLRTEPTWMSDMKPQLSSLLLRHIFLPGTHDAGSYTEYTAAEGNNLIFKYTITQEEDILSQLINGIRYLDIRVGYYPNTDEKWYLNHGVISIHPLRDILEDVQTFMEKTNEIVILDFHEFPVGFGSGLDVHKQLVEYLTTELGEYAASPGLTWDATLGDIWTLGKRLVVSYNNNNMVASSTILWSAVDQKWGDVQSAADLYTYLAQVMASSPPAIGWSANSELTPKALDIVNDTFHGLRNMAEMVNRNVTEWFRGEWGQRANIVSADYFRATGLVDEAIRWNKLKAQGTTC